ncbi:MAG: hypothetical protein ACTSUN_00715 [Promethearchaeota archaeon]
MVFSKTIISEWKKILEFNNQLQFLKKPETSEEILKIPLTPFKMNGFLFHSLVKSLYPRFITDKKDILDVIISKEPSEISALYFYRTSEPGIQTSLEKIDVSLKNLSLEKIESLKTLARRLHEFLLNEKGINVGSIKIIREEIIHEINEYNERLENVSFEDFIILFLDLLEKVIKKELIYFYPLPNFYSFLKDLLYFINPFKLSAIYKFLVEFLPEMNNLTIFQDTQLKLPILLKNKKKLTRFNQYQLEVLNPNVLTLKEDNFEDKKLLMEISRQFNVKNIYYFPLSHFYSILSNLVEMQIPFEKEQIKLILQKLFFGIRKLNEYWYFYPLPKASWNLTRFLIRIFFTLNINFKKLSYWAIPTLIFEFILPILDLSSTHLLILTQREKFSRIKPKNNDLLKKTFKTAFLIESKNKKLKKIHPLSQNDLFSQDHLNDIKTIFMRFSRDRVPLSSIIVLDYSFMNSFINSYVRFFYHFNLYSKLKIIRMLKKKYNFDMYPKSPLYSLILRKNSFSLLKIMMRICVDKHEF